MALPTPSTASFNLNPPSSGISNLSQLGLWTSIAGSAIADLGTFYSVKAQQSLLKQQALDLTFQGTMSAINARAAEFDAGEIIAAGHQQAGSLAQRYGQLKAEERAATAGRGIKAGKGSAAEVQASIELAKQQDVYTVNSNAVRQAAQKRVEAQNIRNAGALAYTSAQNVLGTRRSLRPEAAYAGSLLTSASGISQQWLARNRFQNESTFSTRTGYRRRQR